MLNNLYMLVGPSGSGKTTISEALEKRFGYRALRSYTDRPKRYPAEDNHTFISTEEFGKLKDIVAYTRFDGYQYCATADLADNSDIYVIDPAGVRFFRRQYNGARHIKVIGLRVPQAALINRMHARGDSAEVIQSRLKNDTMMFSGMHNICNIIVDNIDLEKAIRDIHAYILRSEARFGKGPILRMPTDVEYLQLCSITSGRNDLMHWKNIYTHVENPSSAAPTFCAPRGGYIATDTQYCLASAPYPSTGFRPVLDGVHCGLTVGSLVPMGTMYMGDEPVRVPSKPYWLDGDMTRYTPGSNLEMEPSFPDSEYQIMGYHLGDGIVIADRCVLCGVSYNEILRLTA